MQNKNKIRIGIDLMGNDNSPDEILRAILTLRESETCHLIPFISEDALHLANAPGMEFVITKEFIAMDESPLVAIRRKKDSSIYQGMLHLKEGLIDAFISAGNTGALMASAKMVLPSLPNVSRPALLALLPTKKEPLAVLDVGASVDNKSEHLVQFALMGAAFQKCRKNQKPKIALLNIGSEEQKGTSELKKAYQELKKISDAPKAKFEFVGNAEGKEVFEGLIDVLVTPGFTGNIFLKTAEGIANFIIDSLEKKVSEQGLPILLDLQKRLHYDEYPGAILCGVDGIIIKCHGYSSPKAILNAIRETEKLVAENFLLTMKRYLLSNTKGLFAKAKSLFQKNSEEN